MSPGQVIVGGVMSTFQLIVRLVVLVLPQRSVELNVRVLELMQPTLVTSGL